MQKTHFEYMVLGGGISGLACSLELQELNADVCLIEKSGKTGGVLQTLNNIDCYWDRAAHTIAVDQELFAFFERFNIEHLLEEPSLSAKNRQIVVNGEICNISNHPAKILTADFLSLSAKWQLIKELFKKPIRIPNPTVREFFEYHFGGEITENIVSAVFSGIYSGDIEKMEMRAVMGKVYEIEQDSGSLIRGLIKQKSKFPKRSIYGINGGMKRMNAALASQLVNLELDNEVLEVKKENDIFYLKTEKGERTCNELISCLPAYNLSNILFKGFEMFSMELDEIEYNPMVLIHVAFDKSNITEELNAFGFLCSQYESPVLKGAIYNSILFPDRSREDQVTFTIFMKPELEWVDIESRLEEEVVKVIVEFQILTKIASVPKHREITVWKRGIPQFNKPYTKLKYRLLEKEAEIEGFSLSGSYISGVSVADCIKYNVGLAARITT